MRKMKTRRSVGIEVQRIHSAPLAVVVLACVTFIWTLGSLGCGGGSGGDGSSSSGGSGISGDWQWTHCVYGTCAVNGTPTRLYCNPASQDSCCPPVVLSFAQNGSQVSINGVSAGSIDGSDLSLRFTGVPLTIAEPDGAICMLTFSIDFTGTVNGSLGNLSGHVPPGSGTCPDGSSVVCSSGFSETATMTR